MIIIIKDRRHYGFLHLLFDVFMTAITGGLWIFVIIIQYLRTH